MTTTNPPLITDRSAIETDWKCSRRLFWNRYYGIQGLSPTWEEEALVDGIHFHEDFANVALHPHGAPTIPIPEPVVEGEAVDQLVWERWARRAGMEHAYRTIIFPEWIEPHYDVVEVEKEMALEHGDLWVAFTPDLLLRKRQVTDTRLVNIDFKSVGRITREWAEHWPYAIQLHLNSIGIEREYEEEVSHSLVVGLDKGYRKDGKIRHPYTWAYTDGVRWSHEWKRDWILAPLWEKNPTDPLSGIRDWVNELGPEVAKGLFPVSLPITPDRPLADQLLTQVEDRMRGIRVGVEEGLIGETFPQNFSACRPTMGPACPFLHCCHNADVGRDPIGSGLFTNRIPHHDVWGLIEE